MPDRHSGTPGPDGERDRPGDDQQQIQVAGRKNAQGLELLQKLGRNYYNLHYYPGHCSKGGFNSLNSFFLIFTANHYGSRKGEFEERLPQENGAGV